MNNNKSLLETYTKQYQLIYDQYNNNISNETIKIMALINTIIGKDFNLNLHKELLSHLNQKLEYSVLSGDIRYIIASSLMCIYEYPFIEINRLYKAVDLIQKYNIDVAISPFIAFLMLDNKNLIDEKIKRAREIYYGMQDEHSFITGDEDYPLAILMSELDKDIETLVKETEYYYDNLAKGCYKRGNELQLLSHILTVLNQEDKNLMIKRSSSICELMKQQKIKLKGITYGLIGFMSVIGEDAETLLDIVQNNYNKLDEMINYKRDKNIDYCIAILLGLSQLEEKERIQHNILLSVLGLALI